MKPWYGICREGRLTKRTVESFVLVLAFGVLAVAQQPPPKKPDDGSEPLTQTEIDALTGAFNLIEAMGNEEGLPPDIKDEYTKIVKNLRDALTDKPPRIRAGGVPKGGGAATRGESDDPKKKELRFEKDILAGGTDKTKPGFIILVDIAFHEGAHLEQKARKHPAADKPAAVLEWKIGEINNEIEAYGKEHRFKGRIFAALDRMVDNLETVPPRAVGDGVPPWAVDAWGGLSVPELSALRDAAYEGRELAGKAWSTLKKWLKGIKSRMDAGQSPESLVLYIDNHLAWRSFVKGRKHIGLTSDSSELTGGGSWEKPNLETGIPHPQDMVVIEDWRGRSWLLVCGVDSETNPRGIVRAFPELEKEFPPKEPPRFLTEADSFEGFDETRGKTIIAGDVRLGRATSLVAAPDGRVYVWDVDVAGLYPMTDIDGDRVPDFVEFRFGSLVKATKGLKLTNFAHVSWIGNQPVAQMRIAGAPALAADPMIFFRDVDGDGYFESVLPLKGVRVPEKGK